MCIAFAFDDTRIIQVTQIATVHLMLNDLVLNEPNLMVWLSRLFLLVFLSYSQITAKRNINLQIC